MCCKYNEIDVMIDGTKTKQIGGGNGDGTIKNHTVEIKCARLNSDEKKFQHELGENPWKANYMIFLDITPNFFYLTIFKNLKENEYKSCVKPWIFPTRSICWRKKSGAFKFDTTIDMNENAINKGNVIKIDENITLKDIGIFINNNIM